MQRKRLLKAVCVAGEGARERQAAAGEGGEGAKQAANGSPPVSQSSLSNRIIRDVEQLISGIGKC